MNCLEITPVKRTSSVSTSTSCRSRRVLGRKRNELVSHVARQEQLLPNSQRRPGRRSGYRAEESVLLLRIQPTPARIECALNLSPVKHLRSLQKTQRENGSCLSGHTLRSRGKIRRRRERVLG